jgi:small subunit ribosomal protein S16
VAVKLRLMRMGKKKQPTYRLVAADSRSPRDGRFIEAVGVYAPRGRSSADRDAVVQIDEVKVIRWLSDGAKPTDRVERILQQLGTLDRFRSGETPRTEAVTAGGAAPAGRATATATVEAPAPAPASEAPAPEAAAADGETPGRADTGDAS